MMIKSVSTRVVNNFYKTSIAVDAIGSSSPSPIYGWMEVTFIRIRLCRGAHSAEGCTCWVHLFLGINIQKPNELSTITRDREVRVLVLITRNHVPSAEIFHSTYSTFTAHYVLRWRRGLRPVNLSSVRVNGVITPNVDYYNHNGNELTYHMEEKSRYLDTPFTSW